MSAATLPLLYRLDRYQLEQATDREPYYWVAPDTTWTGDTPLWAVHKAWAGGEQTVMCARAFQHHALEICAALRYPASSSRAIWPAGTA